MEAEYDALFFNETNPAIEDILIITSSLLFLMAFDIFYWRSCRQKACAVCPSIICKSTVNSGHMKTWRDLRGHTISDHGPNQHHDVVASYDASNDNPYFAL